MVSHHRRFKATWRTVQIARELVLRGHRVTVICIADTRHVGLVEYVEEGVVMVESPDLLFGKLRSGWDPWTTLRRMQYLKNRDYDLVHAFETRPATIYPILNLMKRKRIR